MWGSFANLLSLFSLPILRLESDHRTDHKYGSARDVAYALISYITVQPFGHAAMVNIGFSFVSSHIPLLLAFSS